MLNISLWCVSLASRNKRYPVFYFVVLDVVQLGCISFIPDKSFAFGVIPDRDVMSFGRNFVSRNSYNFIWQLLNRSVITVDDRQVDAFQSCLVITNQILSIYSTIEGQLSFFSQFVKICQHCISPIASTSLILK